MRLLRIFGGLVLIAIIALSCVHLASGTAKRIATPAGELGYAERTTNTSTSATSEDTAALVLSDDFVVPEDESVDFSFGATAFKSSKTSSQEFLSIQVDGVRYGHWWDSVVSAANRGHSFPTIYRRIFLTAGSHTVTVQIWTESGAVFTLAGGDGGDGRDTPAWLKVSS